MELKVALPGDQSHSWYQNVYDARAYNRLCTEFKVSPDTDWRQKLDHWCQGLGLGARIWSRRAPTCMRTTPMAPSIQWTPSAITGIYQGRGRESEGFTQAGVECLNDSIRTYVWAILGAQAQTRSNILKAGTGFDTQKQFLANVEEAIASPVDIPSSLARYQKTLQYASTPLDFVFGLGLYLAPSDMTLHPGNVQGYNEIVIVGSEAAIVHNLGINESEQMGKTTDDKSFEGKIAAPAGTDHKGPPSGRVTIHASHCCSATTRGCDKPRRRENGSHSSSGRGRPSGAFAVVEIASPLRPREQAPPCH